MGNRKCILPGCPGIMFSYQHACTCFYGEIQYIQSLQVLLRDVLESAPSDIKRRCFCPSALVTRKQSLAQQKSAQQNQIHSKGKKTVSHGMWRGENWTRSKNLKTEM